jgi:hypothetical protein
MGTAKYGGTENKEMVQHLCKEKLNAQVLTNSGNIFPHFQFYLLGTTRHKGRWW